MMEDFKQDSSSANTESIDIREAIAGYVRYWYIFVLAALLAVLCAYLYLRYAPIVFRTASTIVIKDDSSGGLPEELSALANFSGGLGGMNASKLENDLVIFNSKKLNEATVSSLNSHISYKIAGNIKDSELYNRSPIVVKYVSFTERLIPKNRRSAPVLNIRILSDTGFQLVAGNDFQAKEYNFGELISLPFGEITVLPNTVFGPNIAGYKEKTIIVSHRAIEEVATMYQYQVAVTNKIKNSNVVELAIQSTVPKKAEDYLNELIVQFNKDASSDRSQIAENTSAFIDERLAIITRELDSVEGNKERFKRTNRLTDIASEVELTLQNANEFERQQFDLGTQLALSNAMIQFIATASNDALLPANIGLNAANVSEAVAAYNQLVLERNRLLKNATSKNPIIVNLTNQINQLRVNIASSLKNAQRNLALTIEDLNIQAARLNTKIAKVPTNEKVFRSIERQQSIKEQLYLFLLTQREQTNISLSVTAPKAKVVDFAYTSKVAVSPKRSVIYAGAALLGLLIPFLFIYVKTLLDNKIRGKSFIEKRAKDVAVVGEIPFLAKNETDLIETNDRSVLAESFRILRTNLQYLLVSNTTDKTKAKTIFVTSTVKGEGKTLVSVNLALTLTNSGKKVLLVGADIRNPQLQRYMSEKQKKNDGVVEYLINTTTTLADYVMASDIHENMSIIMSGAIPPNPAELWMQPRAKQFFNEIKEGYDYVVVDTAPSMLVTDTFLINTYADVMLYVVRAGYTEKRLLNFPLDNIKSGKLKNVAFVLNAVSMANFGYGNKYGYSYGVEKTTTWDRFKKLFS